TCSNVNISAPSDTDRTISVSAATLDCVPLVRLKWTPYVDFAKKIDNYNIYRAAGGGAPVLVKTLSNRVLSYIDSAVKEGTNYCYYLLAGDVESGYSSRSASICISPLVYPVSKPVEIISSTTTRTGTPDGKISLVYDTIKSIDTYAVGYRIYHAVQPGGPYTMIHEEKD